MKRSPQPATAGESKISAEERISFYRSVDLWPIEHTAEYYNEVARRGGEELCRAVLMVVAERMKARATRGQCGKAVRRG